MKKCGPWAGNRRAMGGPWVVHKWALGEPWVGPGWAMWAMGHIYSLDKLWILINLFENPTNVQCLSTSWVCPDFVLPLNVMIFHKDIWQRLDITWILVSKLCPDYVNNLSTPVILWYTSTHVEDLVLGQYLHKHWPYKSQEFVQFLSSCRVSRW